MNKYLLTVTVLFFTLFFSAAQPGALDLSFNPGTGADSTIRATAIQSDGKILIGGNFIAYNGAPAKYLARLNANGSRDFSFNIGAGPDALIYALAIQPDGKILAGGRFIFYDGDSSLKLVRLHTDGSRDTSFNTGSGFGGSVKSICVQPDGKIIVGGNMGFFNGLTIGCIVRLNSDGSLDNTFNTQGGANGSVETMAIQADGKIIIGGSFTSYAGLPYLRIVRLNTNGTPDAGFNNIFGGASGNVSALAIQPNGKILLGGDFTDYQFVVEKYFMRINPNGAIDYTFENGLNGLATNAAVSAIKVLNSGDIVFGGNFTTYAASTANRIGLVDIDGYKVTSFNEGTGTDNQIFSIAVQSNEKIIISGAFTSYNGVSRNHIARLYSCLTPQPDSIYGLTYALCSGTQQTYTATPVSGAAKYEWTLPSGWLGSSDSASIIATSNGAGGIISVKAFTDSCGYSFAAIRNITTIQPPGADICLVTVDTASTHNIVMWEKPQTNLIDSFFIYREISSNVYTKVGAVPYDSLSEYHDFTANPNTTSYRYKLSVLDTCGAESDLSHFHNTIHLQNLGNGNFQWTFYQIEPGINPVISFNVYRDNLGNGNFSQIGFVPGTNATFTDINWSSFPNSIYVVDVNWGISCTPTRAVNTTRSNIRHRGMIDTIPFIGIQEELMQSIEVYPNPAEAAIHILIPESVAVSRLQLFNAIGQLIITETDKPKQMNVAALPKGVYTLSIETNLGRAVRKIFVQ